MSELTQKYLKEILDYDPKTGYFTAKVRRSNIMVGDIVGSYMPHGYVRIIINYKRYYAHRLAWFYVYGEWPRNQLDHVNCKRSDNRINNLRDADQFINSQNLREAQKNNKSGILGVYKSKLNFLWIAQIKINGKSKHIGCYQTNKEAHEAYKKEKRVYHEGFTL